MHAVKIVVFRMGKKKQAIINMRQIFRRFLGNAAVAANALGQTFCQGEHVLLAYS